MRVSQKLFILAALFMFSSLFPNIYAQNWGLKILDVDTSSFPHMRTYFSVYEGRASFINDIKTTDVELFEGKKKINHLQLSVVPNQRKLSVVLLLDASGSMQGEKIMNAKEAAEMFFNILSPEDEATLITFGSDYRIVSGLTNDFAMLKNSLQKISLTNRTILYDGLLEASKLFSPVNQKRNVIILITDGKDEGSLYSLDEALEQIIRKKIEVFSLGIGNDADIRTLGRIAKKTKSRYYGIVSPNELREVLGNIYNLLAKNYLVEYSTPDSIVEVPAKRDISLNVSYRGVTKTEQTEVVVPKYILPVIAISLWGPTVGIIAGLILLIVIVLYAFKRKPNDVFFSTKKETPDNNPTPDFGREFEVKFGYDESDEPNDFEERVKRDIKEQKTVIINKGKFKTDESLGYLVLRSKKLGMYVYEIKQLEVVVGRGTQSDIILDDETITRLHAKIRIVNKIFFVDDLGSSNGTFVNGEIVYHAELKDGDVIGIGEHELIFKCI